MPKASTYRQDGKIPQSNRTRNTQLDAKLPSSRTPVCQALYDFLRLLLGINGSTDLGPPSPSPEILAQFDGDRWSKEVFDESLVILGLQKESATPGEPLLFGKKKTLSVYHRTTFLQHLEKHWDHARFAGAFLAYPMDPRAAGDPPTMRAIITRWFNGRREKILKEERRPGSAKAQAILVQKSQWRRKAKHRTDTLKKLKVPEKFEQIFEDPLCNSDTEKQADGTLVKVPLKFRSNVATSLAAKVDQLTIRRKQEDNRKAFGPAQLLETSRQHTRGNHQLDRAEKVPRGLAEDFYDGEFFKGLGNQAQYEMCTQPRLGLSDLLLELEKHSQQ
ncbi:hypothetical protein PGT21_000722 [Puccinia graminis f. sp. tritici]|uniref:Uncharacterized protein n=1 Tax=Puccinia graminis f. sp. tritici TaxID=56615 RepID=A0A5B0PP59_PUCGR|nr:hypothetical protein PGT21_000722 [Puccinia graminis f. sp. tritici]